MVCRYTAATLETSRASQSWISFRFHTPTLVAESGLSRPLLNWHQHGLEAAGSALGVELLVDGGVFVFVADELGHVGFGAADAGSVEREAASAEGQLTQRLRVGVGVQVIDHVAGR